ncbi:glycosyltransferase [[Clostridium] spiroforme]|nr:glycosyltransferase [Thomasclavelia spiroformis]
MKIVAINSFNFGSTGNIMLGIAHEATKRGIKYYTACPAGRSMKKNLENHIFIGNRIGRNMHLLIGKYTGFLGCFSIIDTLFFLKKLNKIKPDIIHLHNLHNCYINLPMLFKYIKKRKIPVIWTLHDCWSITGQCTHFTLAKCDKWKSGCFSCPNHKEYPATIFDNTKKMWKLKRKWFNEVETMIIVTPSLWLKNLVEKSYLNKYQIKVVNNGIDLEQFTPLRSDLKTKYGITSKQKIILGVAFNWEMKKGLDIFIELSKRLPSIYKIILVGTDSYIDKTIPSNIISIHKTKNQRELAKIYSCSDVFVNPTREDNYPTVNMEALACGIPVITFDTGGSPEIIDNTCGSVVSNDDIDTLQSEIERICKNNLYSFEACLKRSQLFDAKNKFKEYLELYEEVIK